MLPISPFLLGVLLEIALLMQLGTDADADLCGSRTAGERSSACWPMCWNGLSGNSFETQLLARSAAASRDRRTAGITPDRAFARIVEYHDWGRNQVFAPIALVLFWHAHLGFAVERWRVRCGRRIADWIQAVGEIEALSSIAGYAAEHPEDPWPELAAEGPLFDGQGIAHPLLAAGVRNDLRLARDLRLCVVSGSNMSGKSTMLAIGGIERRPCLGRFARESSSAPRVPARRWRFDARPGFHSGRQVALLRRDHTSSTTHGSCLPAPRHCSFCLDELAKRNQLARPAYRGGSDRAEPIVESGAVGLVTTHDLALAGIAEQARSSRGERPLSKITSRTAASPSTIECGREWSRKATRSN